MLSPLPFDLLFLLYLVFRFFEKIFGLALLGVDKSFVLIYGICFDLLLAVLLHSRKVLCILELLARFADNILEITNQECLIFGVHLLSVRISTAFSCILLMLLCIFSQTSKIRSGSGIQGS